MAATAADNPTTAVQRASDTYTDAKFTASPNANLLGDDSSSSDAEADLVAIINGELPDALQFIDSEMGQKRAKATEYYHGDPFGNEEEGRSKVVSRDVLAVVQALMPSIMRTFFGGRRRVRFRPAKPQDIPGAKQATEFVNKITLQVDNDGFLEFYAAAKDALIRYKGVFKWWWDDAKQVTTDSYTGLDQDALLLLANDPTVTDLRVYEEDQRADQPKTYSAVATRTLKSIGKARFGCVPPEELLVNRDARTLQDARFVDHRRMMTLGDLVALGYDKDDLMDHLGATPILWSPEVTARMPLGINTTLGGVNIINELQMPVTYHEVYCRADMDGDDYPELIRACGVGDGAMFTLLHWEPVAEIPFAALDPDPEPHTLFGLCPGGNVMDIQLIKSSLLRMSLDGASLALDPRMAVVEHMVELDDLLNPEVGGIVRTRAPGQIEPIRYDFNPQATMGLLEYMDQVREERTRQSRPSQGLDADSLQSSAKLAVAATLSGAQQQQEMICRLFMESGVKQLFRGILGLLVRNQTEPRVVEMAGEWVPIDPRTWNADMDVEVEVAVGIGGVEMEMQALLERKATQEAILQQYGAANPIVTIAQYRDTLVQLDELRGLVDASVAWKPVDPNWQPPAPSTPSAEQIVAQTAQQELALKRDIETAKLAIEREKMLLEDQRERTKIAYDFQKGLAMAAAQAKQDVVQSQYENDAERERMQMEHESEVLDTILGHVADVHESTVNAQQAPAVAAAGAGAPSGG